MPQSGAGAVWAGACAQPAATSRVATAGRAREAMGGSLSKRPAILLAGSKDVRHPVAEPYSLEAIGGRLRLPRQAEPGPDRSVVRRLRALAGLPVDAGRLELGQKRRGCVDVVQPQPPV